jgi:serine/threonine protein kinase
MSLKSSSRNNDNENENAEGLESEDSEILESFHNSIHHSQVGTPSYMAPEAINSRNYNRAIDWWSMGVTLYECASRGRLFTGKTRDEIFRNIKEGSVDFSKIAEISEPLCEFTKRLLERDYKLRLGSEDDKDVISHPFFEGIKWKTISKDEAEFSPPQRSFQNESQRDMEQNRNQFYGLEDPKLASSAKLKKFVNRRRGKHLKKWDAELSLSKATIDEHPDEDKSSGGNISASENFSEATGSKMYGTSSYGGTSYD